MLSWPPPVWREVQFSIHSLDMSRCAPELHQRFGDIVGELYRSNPKADVECSMGHADVVYLYRAYGPGEIIERLLDARRAIVADVMAKEARAARGF